MTHFKKLFTTGVLALFAALLFVPMASAGPRVVFRGGVGWGPGWGWGGWGAYNPYYYGYGYAPYPYANQGDVKIKDADQLKADTLYIDGGYVGLVKKNKDVPLRDGNHSIELRDPSGQVFFQQNVQVIPGKTTELYPAGVQPDR